MSKSDFIDQWSPANWVTPVFNSGFGVGLSQFSFKPIGSFSAAIFPNNGIGQSANFCLRPEMVRGLFKSYNPSAWGHQRTWEGVTYRFRSRVDSGARNRYASDGSGSGPVTVTLAILYDIEWTTGTQSTNVITDDNGGIPWVPAEEPNWGAVISESKTHITRRLIVDEDTTYTVTRTWEDEITENDLPADVRQTGLTPSVTSQRLRRQMWIENSNDADPDTWSTTGSGTSVDGFVPNEGTALGTYKWRPMAILENDCGDPDLIFVAKLVEHPNLNGITFVGREFASPAPGQGGADEMGYIDADNLGFDAMSWSPTSGGYGTSELGDSHGQIRWEVRTPLTPGGDYAVRVTATKSAGAPGGEPDGELTLPLNGGIHTTPITYFAPMHELDDELDPVNPWGVSFSSATLLLDGDPVPGASVIMTAKRRTPNARVGFAAPDGTYYRERIDNYSWAEDAPRERRVIVGPFAQSEIAQRRVPVEKIAEQYWDNYVIGDLSIPLTETHAGWGAKARAGAVANMITRLGPTTRLYHLGTRVLIDD